MGISSNFSCCDFQFQTLNKSVFAARSMEFPVEMDSEITIYPKGEKKVSTAPSNAQEKELVSHIPFGEKHTTFSAPTVDGLEWTSNYRYVGINGFKMKGIDEGMNEKGLSFSYLTLLNSKYQTVPSGQAHRALALMDVGAWILGNFATVDEVAKAIKDVIIWEGNVDVLGTIPGLHIALHDAEGKNLVIEFIDGEVVIHENPRGVLTNNPVLEEQLQNLENYKHLFPEPAKGRGIGTGMIGLPGDGSSESRFVRISKALEFALEPKDEKEALTLATQILNTVDIVKGIMIVPIEGSKLYETTRWRVIRDLTKKILYYSSYNDPTLRKIDLLQIPDKKAYKILNVQAKEPTIIDVSGDF